MTAAIALVVDDSRVARMTLSKLLQAQQFEVVEYSSAEEALTALDGGLQPAIIFMDVMMEGMDGLAATRSIKADNRFADVPVVICSGHDGLAEQQHALDAGACAILAKPPAAEALQQVLSSLPTRSASKPMASERPAAAQPDKQALFNELLRGFKQLYLPQLQTTLQQQARETAEAASQQLWQQQRDSLMTELEQSLPQQADLDQQLQASLAEYTATTVAAAIEAQQLPEQVEHLLQQQGEQWLQAQQLAQPEPSPQPPVSAQELAAQLDDHIAPLLADAVAGMQADVEQQVQALREQHAQQLRQQKILSLTAVGLAVVALLVAIID